MKKLSLSSLRDRILAVCTRFPIAIMFVVAFTLCSILVIHEVISDSRISFFVLFYTGSAALLATVLRLWDEETTNRRLSWAVQIGAHLAWLGFMVYFVAEWEPGIIRLTALIAMMVAMVIAGFLVSFCREENDLPLWHFTFRTLFAGVVAVASGALLYGGVSLLFESLRQLFGIETTGKLQGDIAALCFGFVLPIIFLQLLPDGDSKHDHSSEGMPKFAYNIIHYLFVPLTVAYLITLYAYAAKILFAWQLPDGWVSWLVSVLMLGMVVLMFLLYPSRFSANHRFDQLLCRWLPVLVLPLLVLMSVAIRRRISDYGITIPRLYLALFNLWCYGVCLHFIVRGGKRMAWLPATFALLLLLASVGPQSFANITLRSLRGKVVLAMQSGGISHLPLRQSDVKTWQSDTTETHRKTNETMRYLAQTYKAHELENFADSAAIAQMRDFTAPQPVDSRDIFFDRIFDGGQEAVAMPQNRHRLINGYFDTEQVKLVGDTISCIVSYKENGIEKSLALTFSYSRLKDVKGRQDSATVVEMPNATVYLNEMKYSESANQLSFSGYVFY